MRRSGQYTFADGLIAEQTAELSDDWMPPGEKALEHKALFNAICEWLLKQPPTSRRRFAVDPGVIGKIHQRVAALAGQNGIIQRRKMHVGSTVVESRMGSVQRRVSEIGWPASVNYYVYYVDLISAWWDGWRVNTTPDFYGDQFYWETRGTRSCSAPLS